MIALDVFMKILQEYREEERRSRFGQKYIDAILNCWPKWISNRRNMRVRETRCLPFGTRSSLNGSAQFRGQHAL